jgi:predicted transcriptional regulator
MDELAVCTRIVYTVTVRKNITFSADDAAIELAREVARTRHTTLNEAFREWLKVYGNGCSPSKAEEFRALMERLRYADAGRKFTRDEMNER